MKFKLTLSSSFPINSPKAPSDRISSRPEKRAELKTGPSRTVIIIPLIDSRGIESATRSHTMEFQRVERRADKYRKNPRCKWHRAKRDACRFPTCAPLSHASRVIPLHSPLHDSLPPPLGLLHLLFLLGTTVSPLGSRAPCRCLVEDFGPHEDRRHVPWRVDLVTSRACASGTPVT